MDIKITLELPASLLHQVKVAALYYRTTMEVFFCDTLKEKLARIAQAPTLQHRTLISPPPKIPHKELEAINLKM
jgi:hypothetical protein